MSGQVLRLATMVGLIAWGAFKPVSVAAQERERRPVRVIAQLSVGDLL